MTLTPGTSGSALGERLRRSRRASGMSLAALAAAAGVSKGFLSQLENGRTQASVVTLMRIAEAAGTSAAELLAQPAGPIRSAEAPSIHFGGVGATDRLLTPVGLSGFQVLRARVEPGGRSKYGLVEAPESHFVYVLAGELTITVDDVTHRISPDESLSFTTPAHYGWVNHSDEAAVVLWTASPPMLT